MKKIINWHVFLILLGMSMLSVLAVFPYVMSLQGDLIKQTGLPVMVIMLAQLVQSAILFSIAIFVGLKLIKRFNFHLPVLEAVVDHKDYKKVVKEISGLSMLLGIVTAVTIYVTDFLFSLQGSTLSTSQDLAPIWQKLLAALYGGITEEILMRLFLMMVFVWIGTKIIRRKQPNQAVIIISILLAAVIFGLGHLPITASLTKITPIIVTRAIVLNGIGGVVFGWLFWKKGLEAAMIAHFTTDIFLLTVLPLVF